MRAASRAREVARSPSSPPHPSPPPEGLVSAGSSRTQQAAPADGGAHRMRWSQAMNANALRAYFRAKGDDTGCLAYRARMHRLFAELEPSLTVKEQNLADRVRYILPSNIYDVAELERLRREAVPSSDENATAEDAVPKIVEQPANVNTAVNTPVVIDLNDDGTVAQELELEHMRSKLEEAIVETRSTPDTVAFWRGLWSEPLNHSEGPWTEVVASQCASILSMDPVIITPDDVAEAVRRAPNWKSPGLVGLHHYWLKGFVVLDEIKSRAEQNITVAQTMADLNLLTSTTSHVTTKCDSPDKHISDNHNFTDNAQNSHLL
ncbi:unnamed protein product [Parnassius apollo]|uniref:(apollo) hypothetical protein n=1 Tax=Parnassius apollo TaxID=110799 RepID=A0A8S3WUM6_PARAO|nr:unnamed protein product [Parnassius apollo]